MNKKEKVIVAMSGGVDSSVAAALLKKQGYEVIGIFMHFWAEKAVFNGKTKIELHYQPIENLCCSLEAFEDAKKVAQKLDIPLYTLNFTRPFKEAVVDYFLEEYASGRTPNPCVACNKFIKFGLLLERAKKYGAKYVATGHYVRKIPNSKIQITNKFQSCGERSRTLLKSKKVIYKLLRAKDKIKDQSYFLWTLTQKELEHLLFPIGDYTKGEVRETAKKIGLPVYTKKDSQEICFVNSDLKAFLKRWLKIESGFIKDINTKETLGSHEGLAFYTIGQRRGIGIGGGKPYYVVKLDNKKNILWVTDNPKDKKLFKHDLIAKQVSWVLGEPILPAKVEVKIRSAAPFVKAIIAHRVGKNRYKVIFKEPQRAVTPGQSVVFYQGDEMRGGGIIV